MIWKSRKRPSIKQRIRRKPERSLRNWPKRKSASPIEWHKKKELKKLWSKLRIKLKRLFRTPLFRRRLTNCQNSNANITRSAESFLNRRPHLNPSRKRSRNSTMNLSGLHLKRPRLRSLTRHSSLSNTPSQSKPSSWKWRSLTVALIRRRTALKSSNLIRKCSTLWTNPWPKKLKTRKRKVDLKKSDWRRKGKKLSHWKEKWMWIGLPTNLEPTSTMRWRRRPFKSKNKKSFKKWSELRNFLWKKSPLKKQLMQPGQLLNLPKTTLWMLVKR